MRRRDLIAGLAGTLAAWPLAVRAQAYPNKLIRAILPYTAGSPNDVLARIALPHLSSRLGQPVVIDNRPGGGTVIGAKVVMAAEPDGYTLLFSNTPTHFIAPLASKTPTYDPLGDFVPIVPVGTSSLVLVIAPSVPATSVQEFVGYAKANPGKMNFGFGQGTLPHLVGEWFKVATKADIVSIPYRGGAQAVTDMLGGRIQMNLGTTSTLLPLIRDGRVRALAVTSTQRHPDLPEVPTMAESGLSNITSLTYYGLFGPAGIPADVVDKLAREVNESLKSPELKANVTKVGFEPKGGSPHEFAGLIADEMKRWTSIVQATGFTME
jgi:tripartite-type tricarboxylate transporter receptor subunit TctC